MIQSTIRVVSGGGGGGGAEGSFPPNIHAPNFPSLLTFKLHVACMLAEPSTYKGALKNELPTIAKLK
jgi:hypothetical protein